MTNWPDAYRSDDPVYSDPRFQRRVLEIRRPIAFIENVLELVLECGHEAAFFGDPATVGEFSFCPDCCGNARETGIQRMHTMLVLDRLRKNYQEAVNTLIAAGVDEQAARLAALAALDQLRHDAQKEWMDGEET